MIQLPFQMPQQPAAKPAAPLEALQAGERPVVASDIAPQVIVGTVDFGNLLNLSDVDRAVDLQPPGEPAMAARQGEITSSAARATLGQIDLTGGRTSPLRGTALPPELPVASSIGEVRDIEIAPVAEGSDASVQKALPPADAVPSDSDPVREVSRPLPEKHSGLPAPHIGSSVAMPVSEPEMPDRPSPNFQSGPSLEASGRAEVPAMALERELGREERLYTPVAQPGERQAQNARADLAEERLPKLHVESRSPESPTGKLDTGSASEQSGRRQQTEGGISARAGFAARSEVAGVQDSINRARHDLHNAQLPQSGRRGPAPRDAIIPVGEQEPSPTNMPAAAKRSADPVASASAPQVQRAIVDEGAEAAEPSPKLSKADGRLARQQGRPNAVQPSARENAASAPVHTASHGLSPTSASAVAQSNRQRDLAKPRQADPTPVLRAAPPTGLVAPDVPSQRILPSDDPEPVRRDRPLAKSETLVSRTAIEPKLPADRPRVRPDVRRTTEPAPQPQSTATSSQPSMQAPPPVSEGLRVSPTAMEQPATIGSASANQTPSAASTGQAESRAAASNGSQIHDAVEALTATRDAAKASRPELSVRNQDFGTVNIRLENAGADVRAQLSARDPGFVPAVQAAIADRAVAMALDTNRASRTEAAINTPTNLVRNPGKQDRAFRGRIRKGDTGLPQGLIKLRLNHTGTTRLNVTKALVQTDKWHQRRRIDPTKGGRGFSRDLILHPREL